MKHWPCSSRFRVILAATMFCLGVPNSAWTQDSGGKIDSLGDVARKSREQRTNKDHRGAKKTLNEEGSSKPGLTAVACRQTPCSKLSITLPAPVAWTKAGYVPVPLPGHEADKTRVIRIYEADSLNAYDVESAKTLFLLSRFSDPYFFGQPAGFLFDESTSIDGWRAKIIHFTISSRVMRFVGLALVASVPTGSFGFACAFREQDSGDATGICETILNSARIEVAEQYRPQVVPDDPPENDPADDPSSDDPPKDTVS